MLMCVWDYVQYIYGVIDLYFLLYSFLLRVKHYEISLALEKGFTLFARYTFILTFIREYKLNIYFTIEYLTYFASVYGSFCILYYKSHVFYSFNYLFFI